MREIKFRAWHKEDKVMFEVFGIDFNHVVPWIRTHESKIVVPPNKEDVILMQYTGFKDVDDNEIYEGDIVKCIHEDDVQIVYVHDIRELHDKLISKRLISREIIGNRYENPELL